MNTLDVYLETGTKRTFAGALDWPGWCRSGGEEQSALDALCAYGPRYSRAIASAGLHFQPATAPEAFRVAERLVGSTTTDFGAPGAIPAFDGQPVGADELRRQQALLAACWQAFDTSVRAAAGKKLRKGPRGGGRELDEIVRHALEAESAYLDRLGVKYTGDAANDRDHFRQAVLEALALSASGGIPKRGPRGGMRWTSRAFVRRAAWHLLDHAWEIEDRATGG